MPAPRAHDHFKSVKLTKEQERKWDETLAACNWIGPGFVHIMYTMLVPRGRTVAAHFTEEMQWAAATDGYQIIIKPSVFFQYTLMKRVFIMFHEILHNIWDHCGMGYRMRKTGVITWEGVTVPYHHFVACVIQDHIINATLIEAKMGEYDNSWLYNLEVASHTDSWVERYVKVYQQCVIKITKAGGGKGKGKGMDDKVKAEFEKQFGKGNEQSDEPADPRDGQFDLHMDPGTGGSNGQEESKERPERSEIEWQQAVAAGMAVARAQGKLPAALELVFGNILEPVVTWSDHVRALLARRLGSGGYDWRRPDRRLIVRDIVAPGRTGHGCKLIIVGGDNSGSIYSDPTLLGRWLGEIGGMLEDLNPEEIMLVWCDAKVHEVDTVTDAIDLMHIQKRGSTGGGGTSFVPVFEWIEEQQHRPDALIYLTDLMGTFPNEPPSYPVIWGCINERKAPFGDTVYIPTFD
jgi:predicted metal-dependent peptidase